MILNYRCNYVRHTKYLDLLPVGLALGRKSIKARESHQLRDPSTPYDARFGVKKGDTGSKKNLCLGNKLIIFTKLAWPESRSSSRH